MTIQELNIPILLKDCYIEYDIYTYNNFLIGQKIGNWRIWEQKLNTNFMSLFIDNYIDGFFQPNVKDKLIFFETEKHLYQVVGEHHPQYLKKIKTYINLVGRTY